MANEKRVWITLTAASESPMVQETRRWVRRLRDHAFKTLIYGCSGITVALLLGLIGYILYRGLPGISWALVSTTPSALKDTIGILPNILNTFYIILLALVIVLPIGVGAAIYLTEYASNRRLIALVEFTTETLAGIPSILYGLVGMLFFAQFLGLQTSLLSGALTLVIMILPTILRTTEESLKTVPLSYREGALALGSTRWHTIRTIVLPSSLDGIITGCILAVGRIVGESAALLFTAGIGAVVAKSIGAALTRSGGTLSVALYVYAFERGRFEVAFSIAAILLLLVVCINVLAKLMNKKLRSRLG